MATELYVVVVTDTIPFAGLLSVPQSTTTQGKGTKRVDNNFQTYNERLYCLALYNNYLKARLGFGLAYSGRTTKLLPTALHTVYYYSPVHVGSPPDQRSEMRQVRMSIPVRVWPTLQEYEATELYVVVETYTIPFAGLLSVPQSTTVREKSQKQLYIYNNFQLYNEMFDCYTLFITNLKA